MAQSEPASARKCSCAVTVRRNGPSYVGPMSVSARFDESAVTVEPGDEATISVQVLNSGSTVEEFRFEVVGPCAGWSTVETESLSLYPGTSGTATLRLHPPRSPEVAPGETTLGLRVVPTSDANEPVVPERAVTVAPFSEVTAELLPRTSQSAWGGRHKVAVDNRGNVPLVATLTVQSAGERTRPAFHPAELTVPPGEAKLARLTVKPARRLWRGTPVTHPFQALVTPGAIDDRPAEGPVTLDGSYEQQAILPRWLPRALAAALMLAAVLVGLWYSVLRPTVRSAARDAVNSDTIQKALDEASPSPTSGTSGGASGGTGTTGGGGRSGQPTDAPGTSEGATGAPGTANGTPDSSSLQVTDPVGGGPHSGVAHATVPQGKTFGLTDIVVQNPQGDAGTLTVSDQHGTILSLALENFRDSDHHYVTPIEVPAGSKVTMSVDCREVGKPVKAPVPAQCSESVFLGGMLRSAPTG